jgi:hypothetical protein
MPRFMGHCYAYDIENFEVLYHSFKNKINILLSSIANIVSFIARLL